MRNFINSLREERKRVSALAFADVGRERSKERDAQQSQSNGHSGVSEQSKRESGVRNLKSERQVSRRELTSSLRVDGECRLLEDPVTLVRLATSRC